MTAATLVAGAAVVLLLGLSLPLDLADPGASRRVTDVTEPDAATPSIASLEPVWDLTLRAQLTPESASRQPARLAADVAPAPQGIPVSLVGTVGNSLAILRLESGQV